MRRFLAGFAAALVLVIAPVALAAGGDSTVKGNLNVNGNATIIGDVQARSVQAISGVTSNFATMFATESRSAKFNATSGGSGYLFTDGAGAVTARIMVSSGTGTPTLNVPAPILLLQYTTTSGALWFEYAPAQWTCLAGCS